MFHYKFILLYGVKNCLIHETCFDVDRDCISAIGCAWCERQKHGLASVKRPYCADQRRCFGGVEEAVSPYGDEIRGIIINIECSII